MHGETAGDNELVRRIADLPMAKQWFREAQFGLFVHWGLYALPAGEWNGQPVPWLGRFGDNQLPAAGMDCPAEACVTMNETWGYKHDGGRWKSGEELQQLQRQAAKRGCNLLLNVGPKADGCFPIQAVERLQFLARQRQVHESK